MLSAYPLYQSSLSAAAAAAHSQVDGGSGGCTGALAPPPVADEVGQKIDVNPSKGTRDFPRDEMHFRNWLFHNSETSHDCFFEEVESPVLEFEALFIRKAGEEIRDQLA